MIGRPGCYFRPFCPSRCEVREGEEATLSGVLPGSDAQETAAPSASLASLSPSRSRGVFETAREVPCQAASAGGLQGTIAPLGILRCLLLLSTTITQGVTPTLPPASPLRDLHYGVPGSGWMYLRNVTCHLCREHNLRV